MSTQHPSAGQSICFGPLWTEHPVLRFCRMCRGASLVVQLVKNLPAIQETWVQSLGWENPLKKGKATHSSILTWRIPRTA